MLRPLFKVEPASPRRFGASCCLFIGTRPHRRSSCLLCPGAHQLIPVIVFLLLLGNAAHWLILIAPMTMSHMNKGLPIPLRIELGRGNDRFQRVTISSHAAANDDKDDGDRRPLRFRYRISDRFSLYGNLGVHSTTEATDADVSNTMRPQHWSSSASGPEAGISLSVDPEGDECVVVEWKGSFKESCDCFETSPGSHWYGGGEQVRQPWPLETGDRVESPFISGDMLSMDSATTYGGMIERYFLNSQGVAIYVHPDVPLFHSVSNGQLCFCAKADPPFHRGDGSRWASLSSSSSSSSPAAAEAAAAVASGSMLFSRYSVCSVSEDPRKTHLFMAKKHSMGPARRSVDPRMITYPIWSTWARYRINIDQSTVLSYADEIVKHGFPNSQLEIDDKWETCYGEARFDSTKFPDPAGMIAELGRKGFRTTAWITPFVDRSCHVFQEASKLGHLVKTAGRAKDAIVKWWNGKAGIVDFTNPSAAASYVDRLRRLQNETGLDSFKFDGGEAAWLMGLDFSLFSSQHRRPSSLISKSWSAAAAPAPDDDDGSDDESSLFTAGRPDDALQLPEALTAAYVEMAAGFGPMVEVRTGKNSQREGVFFRMLDRKSVWHDDAGLATLIPATLHSNLIGYPYVLPDMIGGNGDDHGRKPEKELFIRWLQANVFMPALQFSYVPWQYDDETVRICRDMVKLHEKHGPLIVALAREAAKTAGVMINRPLWWLDPTDETALTIKDEFLLGDSILVAPVLERGARSRSIYLPRGSWVDENCPNRTVHAGPVTLDKYPAPLGLLPYFSTSATAA